MSARVVEVAPGDAVIDPNVRTQVQLDKPFLDSIKQSGFLQLPMGWQDDEGRVHVEVGQRRMLAARELEMETVQVIIRPRVEAEQARIVEQLAENERRSGLSDTDRVAAWQQLSLFGMPIDDIAKQTGTPRARVRQAVKLTQDAPRTAEVMAEHALTLDQAAQLVEFEDDPALHETLAETGRKKPSEFDLEVQRAHRARESAAGLAALREKIEETGARFISPDLVRDADEREYIHIYAVTHPKAASRYQVTSKEAAELGGLVYSGREFSIHGTNTTEWKPEHYIEHFEKHGYARRSHQGASARGPLTETERQERREKRERNANWRLVCDLRGQWIRDELLQRKTMPDGALTWVARTLVGDRAASPASHNPYQGKDRSLALEWLGIPEPLPGAHAPDSTRLAEVAVTRPGRSDIRVALAVALARWEVVLCDPKSGDYAEAKGAGRYLAQLGEWGYQLADTERVWAHAVGED